MATDSMPRTKISQLREIMEQGRWEDALKFAGKFPDLGTDKVVITRGREALIRPDFFRQIKKDPAALVADGIAAMRRRYGV